MAFQKIAPYLDGPVVAHIMPTIFIFFSLIIALPPFLLHVLFHPLTYFPLTPSHREAARRKYFYFFWRFIGPVLNSGDIPLRKPLIEKAHGTVLEIGPGVGDNVQFYRRDKVSRLILVEPNADMHAALRANANACKYHEHDGTLLILGCGGAASDERALNLAGVTSNSIDTVVSIHVLCGIPRPASAIEMYRRMLKKGGLFIFYEHVRSDDRGTASWQSWYTQQVWTTTFDGCELDRPTGDWIVRGPDGDFGVGLGGGAHLKKGQMNGESGLVSGRWKEYSIEAPAGQPKYTLLPHVKGLAVKA